MDLCNHLLLVSLLASCLVTNYCPHSSQCDSFKTKMWNIRNSMEDIRRRKGKMKGGEFGGRDEP